MTGPRRAPDTADLLQRLGEQMARKCRQLAFSRPVTHVYNPLIYARENYRAYLRRYAQGRKRVLFLGMNPGPFGMAQTGIPFGEVAIVHDWLHIRGNVGTPDDECAARPVQGFACARSEVSGRRLWGLFRERFGGPEEFFRDHLVLNYCPLLFLSAHNGSCRNITPDKLAADERAGLQACCDEHLARALDALGAEIAVGIGKFAAARLAECVGDRPGVRVACIPHPSPANPAANGDYRGLAESALQQSGVWQ